MVNVRLAFLFLLLCSVSAHGQSRFNVCTVLTSWWDNKADFGTSNELLGQFKSVAGREPLIKSVKDEDSGLIVTVGVRYEYEDSKKGLPLQITVVAAVTGKHEANVFEMDDNAEAGASYSGDWGSLFVTKRVVVGSKVHRFEFSCSDGKRFKKRKFQLLNEIP